MTTEKYRTLIPLFQELRGERVLVRPHQESDAQSLFEAIAESREHIGPWEPFADAQQTVEESRDLIIRWMAQWMLREYLAVGLWDGATHWYVGGTSAAGQGYITEAVKLLVEYAFTHLHANRVEIRCDERNERSAAVARRLGFVQEGRLRNAFTHRGELRTTLVGQLAMEER